MAFTQPLTITGKILLIGPSRAGKSFLSSAFREMGLLVVDADDETGLISWRDDQTGIRVETPPQPSKEWFKTHHFLIDKQELAKFLAKRQAVIFFAHCWNIMECLDQFDEAYFMSVPPAELERRMKIPRPGRRWQGTKAEVDFMLERHKQRRAEAKALNIPFLDTSQSPDMVLEELIRLSARQANRRAEASAQGAT